MNINFLILFSLFLGIGTSQAQEKQWTLAECITYALENNITIKQSALSIESANIDTNDAIGNFLPSLNASTSNFWSSGLSADPISGTNRTQTFRSSSYGVSLGITLFDGLKNVKQFQRAKLNKLLSQYNLGKSKDDIVLLIANSATPRRFIRNRGGLFR